MKLLRVLIALSLVALWSICDAALIDEFDKKWESDVEAGVTSEEGSRSVEKSEHDTTGVVELDEDKDAEKTDPRLRRKKRQAFLPYYTPFFGTGTRSRSRYAYPYVFPYYAYPYYNYPYIPYGPFNPLGAVPQIPTGPINTPTTATAGSCDCRATDINCLTNCYYNQYLRNSG